MPKRLPRYFQVYFWDVDWDNLARNPGAYREFLICRLADVGDERAFRWLKRHFDVLEISRVVARSRRVSQKTRQFWRNYGDYLRRCRSATG